jgi:predicted transcriptional regulator
MTQTILTTASIKKITSSKATEIVLVIPSSVSLDQLKNLAKREEFFIALGVSQTEVSDYLEPRRGYQARVDGSGVVQSLKSDEESEDEGEQLAIEDVETDSESGEEEFDEINEEETEESESEEENDGEPSEDEREIQSMEREVIREEREKEDDDKPLTFIDAKKDEADNW